jgi:hypothetical protein
MQDMTLKRYQNAEENRMIQDVKESGRESRYDMRDMAQSGTSQARVPTSATRGATDRTRDLRQRWSGEAEARVSGHVLSSRQGPGQT